MDSGEIAGITDSALAILIAMTGRLRSISITNDKRFAIGPRRHCRGRDTVRVIIDFHTHTFLSDGVLSPAELVQRAVAAGYRAIAMTDHVGYANYQHVCEALLRECEVVNRELPITALAGVEITHVAPRALGALAERCKAAGAQVVAVHGETITEPVPAGTNAAAAECAAVDVLAHPGLLTVEDANVGS